MNRIVSTLLRLLTTLTLVTITCSGQSVAQQNFDHFSTGFPLDGAHTNVTCEGCHTGGVFEATIPACANCHSSASLVRASQRPANHVQTTGFCGDCHTTDAWSPA